MSAASIPDPAVPRLDGLELLIADPFVVAVDLDGLWQPLNGRPGSHPLDVLAGYVAPASVAAIGVVAQGRRHDGDKAVDVDLLYVLTRDGVDVGYVTDPVSGPVSVCRPEGRLADACHRALGLATAPAPYPPHLLPIVCWLDRIMVHLLAADRGTVSWAAVAALCPLPGPAPTDGPSLGGRLAAAPPWGRLRAASGSGGAYDMGIVGADIARWMDDGMFARWGLGSFPDFSNLVTDVALLLPASVARQVLVAVQVTIDAKALVTRPHRSPPGPDRPPAHW